MSNVLLQPLLAYLFRSAVAFYNAKPWKILGEHDQIRINVDIEPPIFASATGGSPGTAPGLSIISAFSTADLLEMAASEPELEAMEGAFAGSRLSLVFVAEASAPQWLRDLRRANKWPLASPSAFPTFVATDETGTTRELQEDDLRGLSVAVSVVSAYVATKRKQIESRVPHGDVIKVRDDTGAERIALVQFPFDPNAEDGWQLYKIQPGDQSNGNAAFEDVWNAALDLPDVSNTLNRLTWSFFQDSDPTYVEHEDEWEDAMQRFLSWAIFAYRANGTTLAERALVQLGGVKSREELEVHHRIVKPRVGFFRVLEVKRNVGMKVHDILHPATCDVVERVGTRGLHVDNGIVGMLHPISETQWILSPGVATYESIPDEPAEDEESFDENFAPALEEMTFGANSNWIQEIPAEHLQDVYESFAEAIAATGDEMPKYGELQQQIARAEQPGDVVQSFAGREWWSDTELNVMMAFVMRAWNVTPREELGGVSPDVKAKGGRVRATRGGGRRR